MKSLLDTATSTGQPVAASSPSRRVISSECRVFLPKSWAGSMRIASRRTPEGDGALGLGRHVRDDVGDDVVVADAVRPGARLEAAGVRAHQADAVRGGDLGQPRVGARPRCR